VGSIELASGLNDPRPASSIRRLVEGRGVDGYVYEDENVILLECCIRRQKMGVMEYLAGTVRRAEGRRIGDATRRRLLRWGDLPNTTRRIR
jgi:hypothetical protein